MKLRGINFRSVSNASGARNFTGQGYWYQNLLEQATGVNWEGTSFIAKTTPFAARNGNMAVKADRMTPRWPFPSCIVVKPFKRSALNAVGLTSPGLEYLLSLDVWQQWCDPFTISFMAMGGQMEDRLRETTAFAERLYLERERFRAPFKVELNISCPNTGHDQYTLLKEAEIQLLILKQISVPVIVKLNVLTSHNTAIELLPLCDGFVMGNTLPWGQLPDRVPWEGLFGKKSPLAHIDRRGGGLSGIYLRDLHCEWIAKARNVGIRHPIEGCGGILSVEDAERYRQAGASAIQLGSISFLAPWNLRSVIAYANDPATKWY